MDIAATDLVLAEWRGAIAWITLNRPAVRNALSVEMMTAIERALAEAADARAVVIAGNGPGFCGGHDLKEMRAHPAAGFQAQLFAQCSRMMQAIANHPAPVIASVHGIATAGGCQLVAACDLAVASEEAKFATSGVNLGLFCSTPGVALARAVPRKAALAMLLTGDFVTASEALAMGLVNRVVPTAELGAATMALAETIAAKERCAIEIGKRTFYRQIEAPLERAYAIASEAMVENMMAPATTAAIDAFITRPRR
ncbi:MAG: enoyl-CoA hydratase [Rhodospirillales bacterium]|nr:enoyl-CoA hydratase [Rhodospirillales bacterium]